MTTAQLLAVCVLENTKLVVANFGAALCVLAPIPTNPMVKSTKSVRTEQSPRALLAIDRSVSTVVPILTCPSTTTCLGRAGDVSPPIPPGWVKEATMLSWATKPKTALIRKNINHFSHVV
jgi:hypothetical protein